MKIRDLGQSFLDFDLSNIPRFIGGAFVIVFILAYALFRKSVSLVVKYWWVLFLGLVGFLVMNSEKECAEYCYYDVVLIAGRFYREDHLTMSFCWALAWCFVLFLDRKLAK